MTSIAVVLIALALPAGAATLLPPGFVGDQIVAGLDEPNSMAFLPDGRILVTEQRSGRVRLVVGGHVAVTDPALVVDSLNAGGNERGLQGLAVDPGWPARPYLYLFYTHVGF